MSIEKVNQPVVPEKGPLNGCVCVFSGLGVSEYPLFLLTNVRFAFLATFFEPSDVFNDLDVVKVFVQQLIVRLSRVSRMLLQYT